ncbi:sialate O-acetylesterase [Paenibacillus eucommiae]|uniref:Sialate O-acetylesterase domain-containing protein n=1 Tax=Paenibacillus eucommiae TaxID=1355755 RepID=A0ABS4IMI5_9BACL|nr:sialate O-acetylesterase [Paenibacillus eucommiae]MBP1988723.1 hypothetical protein [Paenibacillus eucommiae]
MHKQFGVEIIEGPQHWAIIQQKQGFGTIHLKGCWSAQSGSVSEREQVYVRIVKEDGGETVVPWQPCDMSNRSASSDLNDKSEKSEKGVAQQWQITISGIAAGGLYRIESCLRMDDEQPMGFAARGDMIHHVGIGDIWVIAGQSNAAGYGKGPVTDPPEIGIHLLRNNGHWDLATHPFNESNQMIHTLHREPVNPGHSPYLAFARKIRKETGLPIGLLQTALGGSPLGRWNPDEDGDLYRNMLEIIESAGGSVKGILWYQGCSDCSPDNAQTYLERFSNVVKYWRKDLNNTELPILTVQLNRCTGDWVIEEDDPFWGKVREAQRLAAMQLEHVYVVPALDCPLSDHIHNSPAGNLLIGERLGRTALANLYGKSLPHRAPNVRKAVFGIKSPTWMQSVILEFNDVLGELFASGPSEVIFSIEDSNGLLAITDWRVIRGNRIELLLPRPVEGTVVVHGAFEANPAAFLPMDTETQMPMLSFYGLEIASEEE